jgi:hypothetical protein
MVATNEWPKIQSKCVYLWRGIHSHSRRSVQYKAKHQIKRAGNELITEGNTQTRTDLFREPVRIGESQRNVEINSPMRNPTPIVLESSNTKQRNSPALAIVVVRITLSSWTSWWRLWLSAFYPNGNTGINSQYVAVRSHHWFWLLAIDPCIASCAVTNNPVYKNTLLSKANKLDLTW